MKKMKGKTKIMSVTMALLMVLSIVPLWTIHVPVHAEPGDETDEEPNEHIIAFQIDGGEAIGVRYSFSYDNWVHTYYVNVKDHIIANDDNYVTDDWGYVDFRLEDFAEGENAIPVPDSYSLSVRVEFEDTPKVDGGAIRVIAVALKDPWDENPTELPLDPANPTAFLYEFDDIDDALGYTAFNIALSYPNQGDRAILDESLGYLYGYCEDVTNGRSLLARELYGRFIGVPMFESFGLPIVDLNFEENDPTEVANAMNAMLDRISEVPGGDYDINVTIADGTVEVRHVNVYRVEWGYDEHGAPVVGEYSVITLNRPNEVVLCADFDPETQRGTTYYSRYIGEDEVSFVGDADDPMAACIIYDVDLGEHAAAGGNGADLNVIQTDGLFAIQAVTLNYMKGADISNSDFFGEIRLMNTDETYIAVRGSGEGKAYGGLGVNGSTVDTIWRTGEDAEARVYIGEQVVYMEPLSLGAVANTSISSVTLKDATQKDGVTIDASNLNKVKLTFQSNFYDSVPLVITYTSGVTREINLLRIGLVVQYRYLGGAPDFDEGEQNESLWCDFRPGQIDFTYNYFSGEQIVVYATYYHPTSDLTASGGDDLYLNIEYDDGHKEIIYHTDTAHHFNGYLAATDNEVAITSFLIGFAPAKTFDGNVWVDNINEQTYTNKYGTKVGMSMTVLNAGYNDKTNYSGTQVGSGKGVYWDGVINWF